MFAELRPAGNRQKLAQVVSAALHVALLALLLWPETAVFVRLSEVAKGEGGTSTATSIYLPRNGFEDLTPAPGNDTPRHAARRAKKFKLKKSETQPLTLPAPAPPPPQVAEATTSVGKEGDTESHAPRAGSIYGSLAEGPLFGPQVRPALPISGPNPIITRSELPAGVEGSVIVQITIDERGNITSTKLVQKLGYGIDERVLSAVQQWRFKPATRDGVAIASQQTCVFHFPSGAG